MIVASIRGRTARSAIPPEVQNPAYGELSGKRIKPLGSDPEGLYSYARRTSRLIDLAGVGIVVLRILRLVAGPVNEKEQSGDEDEGH